jgi:hypothetical protein
MIIILKHYTAVTILTRPCQKPKIGGSHSEAWGTAIFIKIIISFLELKVIPYCSLVLIDSILFLLRRYTRALACMSITANISWARKLLNKSRSLRNVKRPLLLTPTYYYTIRERNQHTRKREKLECIKSIKDCSATKSCYSRFFLGQTTILVFESVTRCHISPWMYRNCK